MKPAKPTFLSRSPITGSITDCHQGGILDHWNLYQAMGVACRRYHNPIVRVLTRNPVTCMPTAWCVRERARHELSALALRTFILREQGKEAA